MSRERDDPVYVVALDVGVDSPGRDQDGIPLPPARALYCCMRTDGALCEHCPSHPDQKEG